MNGSDADRSECGKRRNGRKMTKHHVIPRSRGGGEITRNIIKIPDRYHAAYHILFGNMTPKEAVVYLKKVFFGTSENRNWKPRELYNLQLEIQAETLRREKAKGKK